MDINRLANCYMARWPGMDYTTAFIKARRVIANAGPIQAKKMRTTDVDVNL